MLIFSLLIGFSPYLLTYTDISVSFFFFFFYLQPINGGFDRLAVRHTVLELIGLADRADTQRVAEYGKRPARAHLVATITALHLSALLFIPLAVAVAAEVSECQCLHGVLSFLLLTNYRLIDIYLRNATRT
jgi:hypothetical protein